MLERRRADLEKWMWKLLSKPALARSSALKSFLELDRAIERANAQRYGPPPLILLQPAKHLALVKPFESRSTT